MTDRLIVAAVLLAELVFAGAGAWVLYVAYERLLNAWHGRRR